MQNNIIRTIFRDSINNNGLYIEASRLICRKTLKSIAFR